MKRWFGWCVVIHIAVLLPFAGKTWAAIRGQELLTHVMRHDTGRVAELLDQGADVNFQDVGSGSTPLILACHFGFADLAALLLDRGAEVNRASKNGATALMGAARRHPELVPLLLQKGADVTRTSPILGGPLTAGIVYALHHDGATSVAAQLLEHGAAIDETPVQGKLAGYTPLMLAVRQANLGVVQFLVDHGADVTARAKDGKTPLTIAEESENTEIRDYLAAQGAKETTDESEKK